MFVKGNTLGRQSKGIPHTSDAAQLSHWLKRFKVKLSDLKAIERAQLAMEAWKVSIKLPSVKHERATRTDDAQRLISALEGEGAKGVAIPNPVGSKAL